MVLFIATFLAGATNQYCIDRAVVYVIVVCFVLLVILVAALTMLCSKKIKADCGKGNLNFHYEQDGAEPNDDLTPLSTSASETDGRTMQDDEYQVFVESPHLDGTRCESST